MLLALDVGNTQTVVGLYDGELLRDHWRTTSVRSRTADELAVELSGLLAIRGRSFEDISATVASSGVPQITVALAEMARAHLGHEALIVGPGVRTGLPLMVDNPHEVGPDRVGELRRRAGAAPAGRWSSSTSARPSTSTPSRPPASSSAARSPRASRSR